MSLYHDWDWPAAERAFRRAIELEPDNAQAHFRYALALTWFARVDEASREIERAQELDPVSVLINANAAQIPYYARRYDRAIEAARRALALDPNFWQAHQQLGSAYVQMREYDDAVAAFEKAIKLVGGAYSEVEANLAHAYAVSGQTGEARKILNDLEDRAKRTYTSPFDIAVVYAGLGDRDQAFTWLERAYEERVRPMLGLKVNPRLDPLRSDPRFAALMRRMRVFDINE